jgi:hypothetical protein
LRRISGAAKKRENLKNEIVDQKKYIKEEEEARRFRRRKNEKEYI